MPPSSNDYDEKRNFIRMFVNANVKINDPATNQDYQGRGKNLSGDGAMFTTDGEFQVGQKLNLTVSAEQGGIASLNAEFKVTRVNPLGDGEFDVAGTMLDVK